MSSVLTPSVETPHAPPPARKTRRKGRILAALAVVAGLGLATWYGFHAYRKVVAITGTQIPTVKVAQGDVSLSVFARGEIRGGNSEQLTAPMTGDVDLHITYLRHNGEAVKPGDVVVQFDTTDQEYARREAESDLAEAKEHLAQATAQMKADQEEDRYAFLKAQNDIKLAELDVKKNPILAPIVAKQNDLALAVARDRLAQLQKNQANRRAADEAGVAIQQAAQSKAQTQAQTAKQNIQAMTVRTQRTGYFALKQNMSQNFAYDGMELPLYQVGDQVHPGMAVAEIPDLTSWEVGANIGELDRGHLAVGDKVQVTAAAFPGHIFHGHIKDIGGTSGPPWDRRFECKVALDDPAPQLRPGMSAQLEVTTDALHNVLWLPAQAMFESDGKTFVYVHSGGTFVRKDIALVRRNETRVVITGLSAGQEVALVNPTEAAAKKTKSNGPLEALPK